LDAYLRRRWRNCQLADSLLLATLGQRICGRKGKTFARTEDIEKLAAEVHVLTRTSETIKTELAQQTETIKAQLSQENWHRQQRWLKKFDAYVDIVDKLNRYTDASIGLRAIYYAVSKASAEIQFHGMDGKSAALDVYNDAVSALKRATAAAQLMCSKESLVELVHFNPPSFDVSNIETKLKAAGDLAGVIALIIISKAQVDLGFETNLQPLPSSPQPPSRSS
jgi:hypothetical protein